MSKLLADQIANYDDNGPIEIKEGLNIASGKPIQIAGSAGSNGNVLVSNGTTVSWSNALDNSSNWDDAHGWGNHAAAGYSTTDTNTTYAQSSVADGSNVNLRLTAGGSGSGNDDILVTAGSNVSFSSVTSAGFTIDAATSSSLPTGLTFSDPALTIGGGSGYSSIIMTQASGTAPQIRNSAGATGISIWGAYSGGGTMQEDVHLGTSGIASVFQDLNPKTDSAHDLGTNTLRWQKVYADAVDTPNVSQSTTNGTHGINLTTTTSGSNVNAIEYQTDNGTASAVRWRHTPAGHLIPNVNAAYDIGNAEYKVRHLFLSDNSLWIGENTRVSITPPSQAAFQANNSVRPVVKFYNRNKYRVPKPIQDAGGTLAGCISHIQTAFPGRPGFINADTLKLNDFLHYWCALTGSPGGTYSVDDLYPSEIAAGDLNPNYWPDDWSDTFYFGQNGQNQAIDINSDADALKLSDSDHFIRNNVSGDFVLKIEGTAGDANGASIEKTFFEIVVWVDQDASPQTISGMTVDGDAVGQITINGTPEASKLQTFKIRGMFLSGLWRATVELI